MRNYFEHFFADLSVSVCFITINKMSIENKCVECGIIIVDEYFFVCQGYMCNKVISYSCATQSSKKLLTKYPSEVRKSIKIIMDSVIGLRWFCPDCVTGFSSLYSIIEGSLKRIEKVEENIHSATIRMEQSLNSKSLPALTTNLEKQSSSSIAPSTSSFGISSPDVQMAVKTSVNPNVNTTLKTVVDRIVTRSISKTTMAEQSSKLDPSPTLANHMVNQARPKLSYPNVHSSMSNTTAADHETLGLIASTATAGVHESKTIIEVSDETQLHDEIKAISPRRWLFVSRIAGSVTNLQFENFVKVKMQLDKAVCVKILPNRENGYVYDYASFRVSLPQEQFTVALNSLLWPPGLLVKEFQWKPRRQNFRHVSHSKNLL